MTSFWIVEAPATLAVTIPVLMMPGLDFAAVARGVAAGGSRAGLAAAAGSALGAGVHIIAAAFGMGAIAAQFPGAEELYRPLSAVLLWWFAWRFLALAREPAGAAPPLPAPRHQRFGASFREGTLASLMNPKTPLFFAAVFGAGGVAAAALPDRISLAVLLCTLHFAWFAGVAIALGRLTIAWGKSGLRRAGAAAAALILTLLGAAALLA